MIIKNLRQQKYLRFLVRRKGSSLSIEQSTGLFSQKSALNELDFWTLVFESLQPKYNKNTRAVKTTLVFLVRRKGFSAAAAAIASLRSLPTAAKTAHRAVFFRMLRILPPCSNPFLCAVIIKSLRQRKLPEVFGTPEGIRTPDLLVRSQTLYPTELPAHAKHISIYVFLTLK